MRDQGGFQLRNRRWYPWIFLGACLIGGPAAYYSLSAGRGVEGLLPAFGVVGGVVGFLYSQHLQQSRLFKQLFTEFNGRYDKLNQPLNEIRDRPSGALLNPEDRKVLFDYFNLCTEQYLFFRAGYIDKNVWGSWCNGMSQFTEDPEIRELWEAELKSNSYYGFTLLVCRKMAPG